MRLKANLVKKQAPHRFLSRLQQAEKPRHTGPGFIWSLIQKAASAETPEMSSDPMRIDTAHAADFLPDHTHMITDYSKS